MGIFHSPGEGQEDFELVLLAAARYLERQRVKVRHESAIPLVAGGRIDCHRKLLIGDLLLTGVECVVERRDGRVVDEGLLQRTEGTRKLGALLCVEALGDDAL
ncbi:MAG: hypothetical protein V9E81_04510 [Marmoricola sp.]